MKCIVNMACGLANRMFQYSYYLFLKSKGYQVEIDYLEEIVLSHEEVQWRKIFPQAVFMQASKQEVKKLGGGLDLMSKISRKFFPFLNNVFQMPTAFDALLPRQDKNQYVKGVFQNAAMVESVKKEVLSCFEFPPFIDSMNIDRVTKMQGCESVAIHVRKGEDYQKRIWYQNTCPLEYYRKAIKWMKNHLDNPIFFVFTDNPNWVRKNFGEFDYILVEGNPEAGWGSHFDMQLMSLCKHNIISNSTYSWWGAYLNTNVDKIVICPKIWFNPKATRDYSSKKLLVNNWISI